MNYNMKNILFGIIISLVVGGCVSATKPAAPLKSAYNAKEMAERWRSNSQPDISSTQKNKQLPDRQGVRPQPLRAPIYKDEQNLEFQDQDGEVSRYSYPVYQADDDNPYVYTPPTPQHYPEDNDADYYYYPLYFSE